MPDEQAPFVDPEAERRTPSQIWAPIRELRANARALIPRSPARRHVLAAALQQAEELFAAAGPIGYASKPLPLFYGLSQAGRAIAAIWAPPSGDWEPSGHGLKAYFPGDDIAAATVKPVPDKPGLFGAVAGALESPVPAGPVPFSRIWSSLPELARPMDLCAGEVTPSEAETWPSSDLTPRGVVLPKDQALPTFLAQFPSAVGGVHDPQPPIYPRAGVVVYWDDAGGQKRAVDTVAVEYRRRDETGVLGSTYFLRPGIEPGVPPPSVLMTWWMLLLALSSCARYHPRVWAKALDVDGSPIAVALERCLDLAEVRVPELIRVALDGPPVAPPDGGDPPLR